MNRRGSATPAPARAAANRVLASAVLAALAAMVGPPPARAEVAPAPADVPATAPAAMPAAAPGAAPAPAPPEGAPVGILQLQEIRPGMEGTARTVFEGERLEEFRVEILGVLRNAVGPNQDLILGRLRGEKVEYTGVVAGMSGSPVYIDGKLIGAVSYRIGQFAKEAIAGITPIADMMRLGARDGGAVGTRAAGERAVEGRAAGGRDALPGAVETPASDPLGRFLAARAGMGASPVAGEAPPGMPFGPVAGESGRLVPIALPLVCSGCDPGVLRYYAPIFEAHGLEPLAGGGVAEPIDASGPLRPGGPVAGTIVGGDLNLAGVGTLTHVVGNRVYAFGHPMLGIGPVAMPMTGAHVLLTFPSEAGSFKIANPTRPVGTIVHDGLTAIVGEIGAVAETLPLTVRVGQGASQRNYRYDILRHRAWSPVLVALTAANSLSRTIEYDASATLAVRSRIDVEGFPPIVTDDLYASPVPTQPVHLGVANEVAAQFNLIYNNRLEEPRVRSVAIEVELLPEGRTAVVSWLRATRTDLRPGETFRVVAAIRPFRGEERKVEFEVTVPEDAPPGEAEIVVGSGPAVDSLDRQVLQRRAAQAATFGDLVRLLAGERRGRSLHLRMTRRAPAAIVRSDVLPDLPLSVFSVFNNPRLSADATLLAEAPILEMRRDLDVVVVGGRRISVRVR